MIIYNDHNFLPKNAESTRALSISNSGAGSPAVIGEGTLPDINMVTIKTATAFAPSPFARKNLLYPVALSDFVAHDTFRIHLHSYNCYWILFVYDGCVGLVYMGKEYILHAMDCFLIDCRNEHTFFVNQASGASYHYLLINGHQMHAFFERFFMDASAVIHVANSEFSECFHELEQIRGINPEDDMSRNAVLSNLIAELMHGKTASHKGTPDQDINHAAAYIENHFSDQLSLRVLSDHFHYSPRHFTREFTRLNGIGPTEYIITARINHAKEQLINSNLTVAEISRAAGFNYPQYFWRAFKARCGLTPLQFRQRHGAVHKGF